MTPGRRKKVVWSEPKPPPWLKTNPNAAPGPAGDLQPGEMSMGATAEEFLQMPDEDGEGEPV